mgnify:CR=1 FL=1
MEFQRTKNAFIFKEKLLDAPLITKRQNWESCWINFHFNEKSNKSICNNDTFITRVYFCHSLSWKKKNPRQEEKKKSSRIHVYTSRPRCTRQRESGLDFHKKKKKKKGSNELATCRGLEIGRVRARAPRLAFKRILIQSFGRESRQGHRTGSIVC